MKTDGLVHALQALRARSHAQQWHFSADFFKNFPRFSSFYVVFLVFFQISPLPRSCAFAFVQQRPHARSDSRKKLDTLKIVAV